MTIEEWNYIYQIATKVVKARIKKRGIVIESELFEEMVLNTTTEYFKEIKENNKIIPQKSIFSYIWTLSNRTSLRFSMQILDNDQPYIEKPKALPINLTRLQAQTPLGHLILSSVMLKNDNNDIQKIFHSFVRKRSIPGKPSLISPYHSNISIKQWIQNRLDDFDLQARGCYFIYKWGIATDEFDPREYGLYRTEHIIDTVKMNIGMKKQILLQFD